MPYRFKEEYRDAVISIPQLRLNITRFNINDESVQKVLKKLPGRYDHNFEFVGDGDTEQIPAPEEKPVKAADTSEPAPLSPQSKLVEQMIPHQPGSQPPQVVKHPAGTVKKIKPSAQGKYNKGASKSKPKH